MDGEETNSAGNDTSGIGIASDSGSGPVDLLGRPLNRSGISDSGTASESGSGDNVRPIRPTGESINGIPVAESGTGNPTAGGDSGPAPFGYRVDGSPAKKRGRKPGSGSGTRNPGASKSTGTKGPSSVKGLERILFSMHMMVAARFATPELALDQKEAELLATAVNDVQEFYGVEVSPEVTIWINLVTALGTVYGPRAAIIYSRKKKAKETAQGNKPQDQKVPDTAPQKSGTVSPLLPPLPGMHAPLY